MNLQTAIDTLHDPAYGYEALEMEKAEALDTIQFYLDELLEGRYAAATAKIFGDEWISGEEADWYKRNDPESYAEMTPAWSYDGCSYSWYNTQVNAWKVIRKSL